MDTPHKREFNCNDWAEVIEGICPVCCRRHSSDQPCPTRIANALTMPQYAFKEGYLTYADTKWIKDNPKFSVVDCVEGTVASML